MQALQSHASAAVTCKFAFCALQIRCWLAETESSRFCSTWSSCYVQHHRSSAFKFVPRKKRRKPVYSMLVHACASLQSRAKARPTRKRTTSTTCCAQGGTSWSRRRPEEMAAATFATRSWLWATPSWIASGLQRRPLSRAGRSSATSSGIDVENMTLPC